LSGLYIIFLIVRSCGANKRIRIGIYGFTDELDESEDDKRLTIALAG